MSTTSSPLPSPWRARPGPRPDSAGAAAPARPSSRWSHRLGSLFGIEVRLHTTFLILLAWIGLEHLLQGEGVATAARGVGLTLALFTSVLLHELGHALVARRFGCRTRHITLLPIGGIATLEKMPERPREELLVAIAGPAVSALIALALMGGLALSGASVDPLYAVVDPRPDGASFLSRLAWFNVSVLAFNLVPAFPMDGGRVLRAALSAPLGRVRATRVASWLGKALAAVFALVGVLSSPMLLFIALFVWVGAEAEVQAEVASAALHGLTVDDAMITEYRSLERGEPLSRAVALALRGAQADFPVLEPDGRIVGVLRRARIAEGLAQAGEGALVADWMDGSPVRVPAGADLEASLRDLESPARGPLLVVAGDALVGMVTAENVAELVLFRSALASRAPAAQAGTRGG